MGSMKKNDLIDYIRERFAVEADFPFKEDNVYVFRHERNRKWFAIMMNVPYLALGIDKPGEVDIIDIKCGPILMGIFRREEGILPGYHMNKDNWATIMLDGTAKDETIKELVDISYHMTKGKNTMNLKELRAKHNLTQAALAKELGVTSKTISLLEGGKLKLSEKLSRKIQEVYGEIIEPAMTEVKKAPAKLEKKAKATEKKVRTAKQKVKEVEANVEKTAEAVTKEVEKKADVVATAVAETVLEAEKKADKGRRKTKAKVQNDKPSVEVAAEAVAEVVAVAEEKAKEAEKKDVKKTQKPRARKPAAKTATAKKAEKRAPEKKIPTIIIQSPSGSEITSDEIIEKLGDVEKAYVRVDQNKAYWVNGEKTGDIDLW